MNKKGFLYNGIIIILLFVLSVLLYFLYFINKYTVMKIMGSIAIILIVIIWLYYRKKNAKQNMLYESNIKRFILITRDGETEKEWYCEGINSLLIGKENIDSEVDIDLSDSYYADYISPTHAVLNYAEGYWYIEDLNSKNGVGIKKRGEEYALRLKPMTSYKIDEGDMIYISKVKLLAR